MERLKTDGYETQNILQIMMLVWLWQKNSNLRMVESKTTIRLKLLAHKCLYLWARRHDQVGGVKVFVIRTFNLILRKPTIAARSEQEIFDDLTTLCRSPGYIHVLAHIALRDNYITHDGTMTGEAMANSYAPVRTVRTEFSTLLGLLVKGPIDFGLPSPSEMQRHLDGTERLLAELHACLERPMREAIAGLVAAVQADTVESAERPFRRADVLREAIFYGGESAYSFQYREMAPDRYAADAAWLLANKAFAISDAVLVAAALSRLETRKISATVDALLNIDPSQCTVLLGFTFTLDEITAEARIDSSIVAAVLNALSISAPTNADFNSLGAFNIANACPILQKADNDYVSLQTYGVFETLYDSPFYWMGADKAYKETAFKNRGEFTEWFVVARLTLYSKQITSITA